MRTNLLLVAFFALLMGIPLSCDRYVLSANGKHPPVADMAHGPDIDVSDLSSDDMIHICGRLGWQCCTDGPPCAPGLQMVINNGVCDCT